MLAGASLGFLGMGAQPPTAEWGVMIADGQPYRRHAWWICLFPGLAAVSLGLGFLLLERWAGAPQRWTGRTMTDALLRAAARGRRPLGRLRDSGRACVPAVRERLVPARPRRDPRHRRRKRLGKIRDLPRHPRPAAADGKGRRPGHVRRHGPAARCRRVDMAARARPADLDDLPEPVLASRSADDDRQRRSPRRRGIHFGISRARGAAAARSNARGRSASASRSSGSIPIRTSCRAA